jgi:branched-chain amino acid transport system substrate-binding protein
MPMSRRTLLGATSAAVLARAGRARAQDQATIRIGVLNDESGIYKDLGGPVSAECTRQAVREMAGHGVTAEVLVGDHQNKPDVGAGIARQWFDRDGVDVVVDVPNSAVALAVANVCREKDKVFLDSGAGTVDLTGKQCSPTTVHWTFDTWMLAHSTGSAMVKQGGTKWFFITADYAFGYALEHDTAAFVKSAGGTVVGAVKHPPGTSDFSSFLVQAQGSGANVIGLCNAGSDIVNCIKQAAEFGIDPSKTRLAALLLFISDVNALGLAAARGLVLSSTYYWDLNARTRAFADRVAPRLGGVQPGMGQAGCYAGTLHYLKAVAAMGAAEAKRSGTATVERMKAMPTDDDCFGQGSIRADGRVLHPCYLFEVKAPGESKGPWDYYKLLNTIPADQAFRPVSEGGCALVRG